MDICSIEYLEDIKVLKPTLFSTGISVLGIVQAWKLQFSRHINQFFPVRRPSLILKQISSITFFSFCFWNFIL